MELCSKRRWTTGSAQQSNMCVIIPCMCSIFLGAWHKHNSFLLGQIQPWCASNKELHGLAFAELRKDILFVRPTTIWCIGVKDNIGKCIYGWWYEIWNDREERIFVESFEYIFKGRCHADLLNNLWAVINIWPLREKSLTFETKNTTRIPFHRKISMWRRRRPVASIPLEEWFTVDTKLS